MSAGMELIYSANECELAELKKLQQDPAGVDCQAFYDLVSQIQGSAMHTYRVTAYGSIRESDPRKAAELWEKMKRYCESGLTVIQKLREERSQCGAIDLYNLLLNYRDESESRYRQNLEDSECVDPEIAKVLFPQMS